VQKGNTYGFPLPFSLPIFPGEWPGKLIQRRFVWGFNVSGPFDELFELDWRDEPGLDPFAGFENIYLMGPDPGVEVVFIALDQPLSESYTFDEDTYGTLTVIEGSLDVASFTIDRITMNGTVMDLDPTIPGTPTPEPTTLLLLATGLLGLAGLRRKFKS